MGVVAELAHYRNVGTSKHLKPLGGVHSIYGTYGIHVHVHVYGTYGIDVHVYGTYGIHVHVYGTYGIHVHVTFTGCLFSFSSCILLEWEEPNDNKT